MMGQKTNSSRKPDGSPNDTYIHVWTEERLISILQHFLTHMSSTLSLYIFIDGLDEFVGDEDILIETIRLLKNSSSVQLCVSSRPEQVFRDEFSGSAQLRLQDFNHEDIVNMTTDRLVPVLSRYYPREEEKIDALIQAVTFKAQGVFLWT